MKAAVFVEDRKVEIRDIPRPKPGVAEVLLKVSACGVCGTDAHIYAGEHRVAKPPVVLGHEICGTAVEVGSDVNEFAPGDFVAVDPLIACGRCEFCHRGLPNLCEQKTVIGYIRDGGFAEFVIVPATHLYRISPEVGFKGGLLVETLACVVHGFDRLDFRAGATVMILGAGTVGLLWNQMLRHSLCTKLVQTEIVGARKDLAKELGADIVVNPHEQDLASAILAECPEGVDYIIDATGDPKAVEEAIPLVRKGGTFLIFGVCPDVETIEVSPNLLYEKEIRVVASKMPPRTFDRSVRLIESGLVDFEKIVNKVMPLDKVEEGFRMFSEAKDQAVKIAIDPTL